VLSSIVTVPSSVECEILMLRAIWVLLFYLPPIKVTLQRLNKTTLRKFKYVSKFMTDISVEGLSAKLKQNRLGCIFFLLLQKRLRLQFNGYIKCSTVIFMTHV
jgi:hypothetical protein